MSKCEARMLDSELRYDHLIKQIEELDPNISYSVVPGSRLHKKLLNPDTEGINENESSLPSC